MATQHPANQPEGNTNSDSESRQEQSDPQLTELKGLTDSSEDLEPTLTDGTKAPEKAQDNRDNDSSIR
jgi:hypothetical protein